MERAEPRFRQRIPCQIRVGQREHSGIVLNVSRTGLFVQTRAKPRSGLDVWIDLSTKVRLGRIPVSAKVVWQEGHTPLMRTIQNTNGFGARIQSAPEAYFEMLAGVAQKLFPYNQGLKAGHVDPPEVPTPSSREQTYTVRLRQRDSTRTRALTLSSASEKDACQQALRESGEEWEVLEVEGA